MHVCVCLRVCTCLCECLPLKSSRQCGCHTHPLCTGHKREMGACPAQPSVKARVKETVVSAKDRQSERVRRFLSDARTTHTQHTQHTRTTHTTQHIHTTHHTHRTLTHTHNTFIQHTHHKGFNAKHGAFCVTIHLVVKKELG